MPLGAEKQKRAWIRPRRQRLAGGVSTIPFGTAPIKHVGTTGRAKGEEASHHAADPNVARDRMQPTVLVQDI